MPEMQTSDVKRYNFYRLKNNLSDFVVSFATNDFKNAQWPAQAIIAGNGWKNPP